MEIARVHYGYAGFVVRNPIDGLPGLSHCGEASHVPAPDPGWHSHAAYEFEYVVRGVWSLEVGGRVYMVRQGEMSITYPHEVHGVNGKSPGKTQSLWVGLELSALGEPGEKLAQKLKQKGARILRQAVELEPAIRGLFRQLVHRPAHFERIAAIQVELILALLLQALDATDSPLPETDRRRQRYRPVATEAVWAPPLFSKANAYGIEINDAIAYMERHLGERLPIKKVAAVTGWSTSYFYRRFHKEVGMSPHAFHLNARLDGARDALKNQDMPITNIAQIFGFSSSQHFSAVFARSFGLSPSAWRAKQLSGGGGPPPAKPDTISPTHDGVHSPQTPFTTRARGGSDFKLGSGT